MNLTIWNENVHERTEDHVRAIYPDGIHGALAAALAELGDRPHGDARAARARPARRGARARPTC